jgi:UDP-N-acetylglucosamine pyrophosphorylase
MIEKSMDYNCSSRYPRLDRETLLPVATSIDGSDNECWYPPGHGDVYQAFYQSGLLDKFIEEGKEFMFLSNIDNLGATVDLCEDFILIVCSNSSGLTFLQTFSSIY